MNPRSHRETYKGFIDYQFTMYILLVYNGNKNTSQICYLAKKGKLWDYIIYIEF